MCDHKRTLRPRFGSSLQHGQAHTQDHARWSRRDFMAGMGLAAAGGFMMLNGRPVKALGRTSLLQHLHSLQTDRILVLIQLNGGNDGLNTIVPVNDDLYYNARPALAIPKNDTVTLSDNLGMHPSFASLSPLYNDGNMAILQNVGYPGPDLSHFRSTDIWATGSDSEEVLTSGWTGRYLDAAFPDFVEDPPERPLAVQIGGGSPLLFQGPTANMGMSLVSVDLFSRVVETGLLYDVSGLPDTSYGAEMKFVRTIANDSFIYAGAIQEAANSATNSVTYPGGGNTLARDLAIIAQLIKGELGARIYAVSLGSFDTHADQAGAHATLLQYLAEGVKAFYDDLAADGLTERVLMMTFSEFGRRIQQNGSSGTDHGTAAPLFLFGSGLNGGLYGNLPNLADPDLTGNLKFDIDFRSVYATVMEDWFGMEAGTVAGTLGQQFEKIGFVTNPTSVAVEPVPLPEAFTLDQNYPNPFNPTTTISYTLARTTHVRLRVFDVQGRLLQTLVDGPQAAGSYTTPFDAARLPSGTYFYRLDTPDATQTRPMVLVR